MGNGRSPLLQDPHFGARPTPFSKYFNPCFMLWVSSAWACVFVCSVFELIEQLTRLMNTSTCLCWSSCKLCKLDLIKKNNSKWKELNANGLEVNVIPMKDKKNLSWRNLPLRAVHKRRLIWERKEGILRIATLFWSFVFFLYHHNVSSEMRIKFVYSWTSIERNNKILIASNFKGSLNSNFGKKSQNHQRIQNNF